jgi:glycosyltransferase involved in cell wall biosynthesis
LVGSGPKEIALRELAGALGINDRVEFAGSLATDHVIARMNESSALAIGSRVDTSPNVVSEAHGIGLPVIGTRAGGIPEMIDEGRDGCLVAVDDDQAMGLCMNKLLSDPEACRRMGKAGQEKVRFLNSPERIAQAHVEFFRKIQQDLGRLQ